MQKFKVINNNCNGFFDVTNEAIFQQYLQKYFKESEDYRIILIDNQLKTEYTRIINKRSIYISNDISLKPSCFFNLSKPKLENISSTKPLKDYNTDGLESVKLAITLYAKNSYDVIISSTENPTHLNKITHNKKSFIYGNIGKSHINDADYLFDEIEILISEKSVAVIQNVIRKDGESYKIEAVETICL